MSGTVEWLHLFDLRPSRIGTRIPVETDPHSENDRQLDHPLHPRHPWRTAGMERTQPHVLSWSHSKAREEGIRLRLDSEPYRPAGTSRYTRQWSLGFRS